MKHALGRLDAGIAAFERGLIVVLLAIMVGSVFLDALHRIFAAEEGRLARLLVTALPESFAPTVRAWIAPALLGLATFGVSLAALRTRQGAKETGPANPPRPSGRRRTIATAAAITAGLAGATQLMVWGVANGFVWSQPLALAFLLWVGLAGASLGAREHAHIAFELAGVMWPHRWRRAVEAIARAVAASFSIFLAILAISHAREHYLEWATSGGAAGLFEAFRVPRFLVFGFLPLPLATMGFRFAAYGVRAPEAKPEAKPEEAAP